MWQEKTISKVDGEAIKDSIYELTDNSLAAVRIPDIFNVQEIDTIVDNINKQGVTWYPHCEFNQGRIGICSTEYAAKIHGKETYFMSEAEASKIRGGIFPSDLDPVSRMVSIFSQRFDTSVAKEPSLGDAQYFTGLVRAMGKASTTHFDYAPQQLPGWWISQAPTQFAVVTYLQVPGEGGELIIYNRQWEPEDEKHNNDVDEKGPKGFQDDFLADEESITLRPNPGEMLIFNSRNFHGVKGIVSGARRLTRYSINSFMSLSNDDRLYLWN